LPLKAADHPTGLAPIPEQGQLVEVRGRPFIVSEVVQSARTANGLGRNGDPQHLVTLSAIEEDALGEELQVIWEIEPGAEVKGKAALPEPDGFDPPARLDAFLNAVRWGASSSADSRSIQSPFRSGIEIEDYQLDPVVRAIRMPRVNLLIADDVGLGKTIEAGLVVSELVLRQRARRVLVVCPASLQLQWRDQMREKFGLEFRIVDSDLLKQLRRTRGLHANPWTHFPRLITSMDFLKRERPLRRFREVLPAGDEPTYPRKFDILIVDEAHNVAPAGRGKYATDSLRTAAMRVLVPHFEHKLFLSATPHNGYIESFSALLELLDNQRFARGVRPDREQLQAIMVRRLKSEFKTWSGGGKFRSRHLEAIEVPYTEEERGAHARLREYTRLRQSGSRDRTEHVATDFVLKLLKKRLFSSPAAFLATLQKHEQSLKTTKKTVTRRPPAGVLQREIDQVEEEYGDDDAYEAAADDALDSTTKLFRDLTSEEAKLLREMKQWADSACARADSKADALIEWLKRTVKPGGKWANERVIVFTEYRATQNWLHNLLAAHGLAGGERLMLLYGGIDKEERERIKAAFLHDPAESPVRILLATDAASEGIDLQRNCHRLIHYEIPWNPNRMEQRNGRIDRHGQKRDVFIHHFVAQGYQKEVSGKEVKAGDLEADLEFLMRTVNKVETIREDLGKVGPVIAEQVEEAMLGRRTQLETRQAEREAEPVRKLLKFERNLQEQVQRLRERLEESRRELQLSPENVQQVVETALHLTGRPGLIPAAAPGIWPDPEGKRTSCPVFRIPSFVGSWASCSEGLAHPHTGAIRPIVFDHQLAEGRDDVVLAHVNHRLVQMCLGVLRAEVWAPESKRRIRRFAARIVPNHVLEGPALIAHGRLVLIGGDSHRLHEEVIEAGGLLRDGRFSRINVSQVRDALRAATEREPSSATKKELQELWPQVSASLRSALEARMGDRVGGLQKFLADRAGKEVRDIRAILTELKNSIQAELEDPSHQQLDLFSNEEKEQFERNRDALAARIAEIPGEIEKETEAVRRRFADPQPRLFPVAVSFLVPEKFA